MYLKYLLAEKLMEKTLKKDGKISGKTLENTCIN